MIKDESSFLDMDKKFSGTITNAKSSKSLVSGKGTVEIIWISMVQSKKKIK